MHKLINKSTHEVINLGDSVTTFRGEVGTLKSFTPPHKPSSTGAIYVQFETHARELYPSVIDAQIVETE